jgi:hypothetical protein
LLPELTAPRLDPHGPIARAARGEPINPLDWAPELAGLEADFFLLQTPDNVRNASVDVQLPAVGTQTLTLHGLIALALDPSNLVGGLPEGGAARMVEKALPYLKGPARTAAIRLLSGVSPELAEQLGKDAANLAARTSMSDPEAVRSVLKATESVRGAAYLGGSIDYGAIDELGRPTGIRAVLTNGMVGDDLGTMARRQIIPPGYTPQVPPLARGHLLGRQLGGSGDVYENLVTLFQNETNVPLMSGIEDSVRAAVEGGQRVTYEVTPIYEGGQVVPARLHIRAIGEPSAAGGEALNIDVVIDNAAKTQSTLGVP